MEQVRKAIEDASEAIHGSGVGSVEMNAVAAVLAAVGALADEPTKGGYDDSELRNLLSSANIAIETLNSKVSSLNSDVSSLRSELAQVRASIPKQQ